MTEKKKSTNTSAPQSINGWNFQVAAAIYIFLNYLKDTKVIGLEKSEDIEIVLNNGKTLFAQAKSSLVPDNIENKAHYTEIYESLRTLEGRVNVEKLIIIFNFYKPFGKDVIFDPTSFDKKSFVNLPSKVMNKLEDNIKKNHYKLDTKKLNFWLLKFDQDNPHNKVFEFMKQQFINLSPASWEAVIQDWRCQLYDNGSEIKRYIDKDLLAGSVMREYVNKSISEELLSHLDIIALPGDFESIYDPCYKNLFHRVTAKFTIANMIYKMYSDYIKTNGISGTVLYDFSKNQYKNCPKEIQNLFSHVDFKYRDNLCKLFLYNINDRYRCIDQIKEVMGL